MSRRGKSTKASTVDLRAFREQRSAELTATTDPTAEAQRHEANFLKGIGTAQEELRWLVEHEAWRTLGFESPVDWWETRIRPKFVELEMRPAPAVARQVMAAVEAHERGLPAAQRRTKKELARLALASDWVALGRRQDRSQVRPAAGADLGRADIVDAEIVDTQEQVGASDPRPTGPEESETPPSDSSAPNPPAPVSEGVQPIATANEREPGLEPAADERTSAADESTQVEDSPETGDGGVLGVAVSGHSHPDREPGEAPADEVEPSVSGAGEMPSDGAEASGDETAGGLQAPGPSAVDLEEPFTEWGDDLIDVIGRRPASVEALGAPSLYLEALWREVDELTQWCDEVDRVRKGAAS